MTWNREDPHTGHIYTRHPRILPTTKSYELFQISSAECMGHKEGWYYRELVAPRSTWRGPHAGVVGPFSKQQEAVEPIRNLVRGLKQ